MCERFDRWIKQRYKVCLAWEDYLLHCEITAVTYEPYKRISGNTASTFYIIEPT